MENNKSKARLIEKYIQELKKQIPVLKSKIEKVKPAELKAIKSAVFAGSLAAVFFISGLVYSNIVTDSVGDNLSNDPQVISAVSDYNKSLLNALQNSDIDIETYKTEVVNINNDKSVQRFANKYAEHYDLSDNLNVAESKQEREFYENKKPTDNLTLGATAIATGATLAFLGINGKRSKYESELKNTQTALKNAVKEKRKLEEDELER